MPTFAHYWGIDEIGIFLVPAIIAIVVFRRAEKKAKKMAEEKASMESDERSEDHVG